MAEPQSGASDAREHAIAERLAVSLVHGESTWIKTEAETFLAIYRAAMRDPAAGGIVLSIPIGAPVDGVPVYRELARVAAAAGWAALSIQQPIPERRNADLRSADLTARAIARLRAGINYLAGRGIANVVVVGDAGGAAIAIQCIAEKTAPGIAGFVALGAWDAALDGIDIPVLGVTGTRDERAVKWQASRMARLGPRASPVETLQIDGAGPGFRGYEELVAKRIRGWLERSPPRAAVRRK
jgi:pimeloyl-ACP methyl ester carboxylesterase